MEHQIADFLNCTSFAVAGASANRAKYGNKVFRCFQQHGLNAVPINPGAETIEGVRAAGSLDEINPPPQALSIFTPPSVTEQIVEAAAELGVKHIWMQPGAESDTAIATCHAADMNVIHSGPCLLVVLGYSES